jgi:hypothetical protein
MVHDAIAILINNLRGITKVGDPIQYPPKTALEKLKALTEVDFGYDTDAWENWFTELEKSPHRFRNRNEKLAGSDNNPKT